MRRFSVNIENRETYRDIKKLAREDGVSLAELTRRALKSYMTIRRDITPGDLDGAAPVADANDDKGDE